MACVLVVDDEPGVRALLRHVLEREGHAVIEAANGRRAMRALHGAPVDLVITDIIMPEQEGMETISEVRRLRPEIKIIAMSGGGRRLTMDFLPLASRMGADLTLEKPFKPAFVAAAVADLLAR
jgi:DNA-binding NtrC family response regulator